MTNDGVIRRFRSQKVAALLAYLALHVGRDCTREQICEMLWPEIETTLAHTRLRVTLSSLRKQLEPPVMPYGTVLDTSVHGTVRLRTETVSTDVSVLDEAIRRKDAPTIRQLIERGELLPTFYDEWVQEWRYRIDVARDSLDSVPVEAIPQEANCDSPASNTRVVSAPTFSKHLPVYLTRFFGRVQEQERLAELIDDPHVRLVTITGGGGNGKTRLSVETSRAWNDGPVWFVSVSNLWDGGRLADVILRSLDILAAPNADPLTQIAQYFDGQPAPLLVLDNLEQIAARAAATISTLLGSTTNLTILAVSRTRLEIPGEQILELGPLSLPENLESDLAQIATVSAINLFVHRSQSVRPDFQLTAHNVVDVVAVCRLLEGIPLAVELAAARSAVLSPAQMHQRLQEHWNALTAIGNRLGKEDRHRSLRAVIEWSAALLPAEQVALFLRLAVFRGGATQEAIEGVCEVPFPLDTLSRLRGCSLVQVREYHGEPRFTILEVLRQWAEEQLSDAEKQRLAHRHAIWFADWATRQSEQFHTPQENRAIATLSLDDANLRWALEQCLETGEATNAHRLLVVLSKHWQWQGRLQELSKVAKRVLVLPGPVPQSLRFDAIYGVIVVFFSLGDLDSASRYAGELESLARESNDPRQMAIALGQKEYLLHNTQHIAEAESILQDASVYAQTSGDLATQSKVLERQGMYAARHHKDYARGHAYLNKATLLVRQLGDQRHLTIILYNIGILFADEKQFSEAAERLNESLALAIATEDVWMQLYCRIALARVWLGLKDLNHTHSELSAALPLALRTGDLYLLEPLLIHLSRFLNEVKQSTNAVLILGAAITVREIANCPYDSDLPEFITEMETVLGKKAFDQQYASGKKLTPSESMQIAVKILQAISPPF